MFAMAALVWRWDDPSLNGGVGKGAPAVRYILEDTLVRAYWNCHQQASGYHARSGRCLGLDRKGMPPKDGFIKVRGHPPPPCNPQCEP